MRRILLLVVPCLLAGAPLAAQDATLQLRYLALDTGAAVSYHNQFRTASKVTLLDSATVPAQYYDTRSLLVRLTAWDSVGADGTRYGTESVLADEARVGFLPEELVERGLGGRVATLVARGDSVVVRPRRALADSLLARWQDSWRLTPMHDLLGHYLASRGFQRNAPQPLPATLREALAFTRGSIAWEGVETRWQRRVVRFVVVGSARMTAQYHVELRGHLLVDSLTGRPLQLGLVGRGSNGDSLRVAVGRIGQRGVEQRLRIWEYSDLPLAGHRIAVVPQGVPTDAVTSLALSEDGRTLVLQTADGQLAFWDAELRRATSIRGNDAVQLAYAGSALFALDGSGFMRSWLTSSVDGTEFGRSTRGVAIEDADVVGFAMAGFYPIVGHADGQLTVRNLGYDRIIGRSHGGLRGLVALAASADGTRLAVVDSTGILALFGVRIATPGCARDWRSAWCEAARAEPFEELQRVALDRRDVQALAVNADGSAAAVATRDGTVLLWSADAGIQRWERAGRALAFAADGRGLFTEFGPLTAGQPPAYRDDAIAALPAAPVIAVSRDGALLYRAIRRAEAGRLVPMVEVLDVGSGIIVDAIRARTAPVQQVAVDETPDGPQFVAATATGWASWDAARLRIAEPPPEAARAFSPPREAGRAGARPAAPSAVSRDGALRAVTGQRATRHPWNRAIPITQIQDAKSGALLQELVPRWGTATATAFSPDGTVLAVGYDNGQLLVYDLVSELPMLEFRAHAAAVSSLEFVGADGRLLSGSADGTMRIWRTDDPGPPLELRSATPRVLARELQRPTHLVATLVAVDGREHVAITGDGYYTASQAALRGIALVNGDEAFDFERFDRWLNRPDVVAARLGLADSAWQDLLVAATARRQASFGDALGFAEARDAAPDLQLSYDGARSTGDSIIVLRVEAAAGTASLQRLDLRVNSVPVHGSGGRPVQGDRWTGDIRVPLGRGVNRIQVSVTDAAGVESPRRTLAVARTAAPTRPTLYVLAVGVSTYRDSSLNLAYAAKDAGDIVRAFQSDSSRYASVQVHRIVDGAATRERILAARAFLERAGVDDELVVFFAGHGFLDARLDYYFGTTDATAADPAARGLGYRELIGLLDGLRVRKRLLLLDTCHAGEVDREAAAAAPTTADSTARRVREFRGVVQRGVAVARPSGSFALMRDLFADLGAQSGATVLSAAGGAEFAMESDRWANGVFTFSILEALEQRRADQDADGQVSVLELERYVAQRVVALTNGGQRPNARQRNLDLDFVVR